MNATQFKISAKMYEARDAMRGILGDKFQDTLMPYREIIEIARSARDKGTLDALIEILAQGKCEGAQQALFISAAIEMIEQDK